MKISKNAKVLLFKLVALYLLETQRLGEGGGGWNVPIPLLKKKKTWMYLPDKVAHSTHGCLEVLAANFLTVKGHQVWVSLHNHLQGGRKREVRSESGWVMDT